MCECKNLATFASVFEFPTMLEQSIFETDYEDDVIDVKESDYLYLQSSQIKNAGQGLFTSIPIYRGELIAFFKGEILTERQVQLRVDKGVDRYFISMLDGKIMDCMKTKCFAKFANDAHAYGRQHFRNNAQIALTEDNRVCLIATRSIKANHEIFCGYGKRYWKKHG